VTTTATAGLRKTALNSVHRRMCAKMVDFGGWDMPVEYSGILAEHEAVRTRAGLFDVSHMGEIEVRGPGALGLVQLVSCNNAAKLAIGQAHYSGLMTSRGTFVDDLLVHKISDTHYMLCVNAGNQDQDYEHIVEHNTFDATVETSIYLDVARRRRGLGTALYFALFQRLAQQPVHVALAAVALPNEASLALHRKLGFETVGTFRNYARKHGEWISSTWLQRVIVPLDAMPS